MKKLKENRGASFVFALVALVVATVISVTVLSAATTTVKRVSDDVTTQQTRLTLTSAAKLVREQMEQTTLTVVKNSAGNVVPDSNGKENRYAGPFAAILENNTSPFTVSVADTSSKIKAVSVTMTKTGNDLTFTFTLDNEVAYLTMTAQSSASVSSTGTTTVTSWQTAVITGVTQ